MEWMGADVSSWCSWMIFMLGVFDLHIVDCTSTLYKCGLCAASLASLQLIMNTHAVFERFFRRVTGDSWIKTGMSGTSGHRLLSEKKVPIAHLGYSLCVGVVPSLQRSQPGSEQPKITAERRMQQNKTST